MKDLVENNIDADSFTISITVKDGGLKLIQVSDGGHGIWMELILAEFATELPHFEGMQLKNTPLFANDTRKLLLTIIGASCKCVPRHRWPPAQARDQDERHRQWWCRV
ncbi:hypothetical protein ZWY2020_048770 [Hordeum vulgare]|nr:hypothetical protein ZWY2020_048770 [Hordeum vulgare]